jgi:hypothetical protein
MAYTFIGSSLINIDFLLLGSTVLLGSLLGAVLLKAYFLKPAPQIIKQQNRDI